MFDWVQNETIDQSVLQAMEIAFSMIIELEQPEPKQKEGEFLISTILSFTSWKWWCWPRMRMLG